MYFGTYLSLVLTTFFWGATFIAGRSLAGAVPPATAAFFRFTIASAALLILCRLIDGRLTVPPPRLWFSLFLLGLTGVFSYNICFFTGLHYIEAGRASLIIALNPLAITLFASLLLKEPLAPRQFIGVIVSLIGALFVISNGHPSVIYNGDFGKGELAILGCVASWATYSLVGRSVLKTMTPLSAVFYSSVIGSLLLLLPALREGSLIEAVNYSTLTIGNLAFLGLCGTAIGFSLYYQAIRKIGATRSGVFINLVPFFAIILSWLILGESIKPVVLSGGVLVLAGVTLTNMPTRKNTAIAPQQLSSRQ
ncbi:DMT family transporter [Desulfopila aestuarii]|uniref:Permease of the drug/metabolite transporter (DMT) superfamily n=1 Tax=Desulfopila aestuarii DSM 18488 TaxID=1121416 RepID=A0A1M7YA41_9BACT|nr:DMT family transporter [Desulfopila aestuarii]SHO49505.1 Permease of the drug/metabolite transporter (DMT) superfamily [Desulfopila aestuarii DSM 18488]